MADVFDDTETFGEEVQTLTEQKESEELANFALSLKKKKKKKKKVVVAEEGAEPVVNTALVAAVTGLVGGPAPTGPVATKKAPWLSSDRDYTYTESLQRVYDQLHLKNPELANRKKHSMPPPKMNRVGTRRTMWANFGEICQIMRRQQSHVMSFFLTELGTIGSLDARQRLILKGRFLPNNIESLLKKYLVAYVVCTMCRNPQTSLSRDSLTRLDFIECESCGSRRSVATVKSGFHATSRQDRRAARAAK